MHAIAFTRIAPSDKLPEIWYMHTKQTPQVTMHISFPIGFTSDPKGKEGTAKLLASSLDEGAGDLTIVQDGVFIGVSAGDRRNNMIKLHTNLQGKTYAFWADSSKLTATGKYDATKMKPAYTIAQIIKNYN